MREVRTAAWYGYGSWPGEVAVIARERIGGKDTAVVSVQFSVSRDHFPEAPLPRQARNRELEMA